MTRDLILYGAALAVELACAVLVILMTADPHQPLPDWARRSLAGEVTHHAPGWGRRPNIELMLAGVALPKERDITWQPLAIGAGPVIDGEVATAPAEPDGEPEQEEKQPLQGPAPYDPLTDPLDSDDALAGEVLAGEVEAWLRERAKEAQA